MDMGRTFAQRLNNAKNMLAGLTANVDKLTKWGITAEVVANGNLLYDQASDLEIARNALKARSQEATEQAEQVMDELEGFCSDAKKIVKIELPKESWPEFWFRQGEYAEQASQKTTS
jgi:hypothetical protein